MLRIVGESVVWSAGILLWAGALCPETCCSRCIHLHLLQVGGLITREPGLSVRAHLWGHAEDYIGASITSLKFNVLSTSPSRGELHKPPPAGGGALLQRCLKPRCMADSSSSIIMRLGADWRIKLASPAGVATRPRQLPDLLHSQWALQV